MKKLLCFIALVFSINVQAQLGAESLVTVLSSGEDFIYSEYYKVKDDPRLQFFNLLAFDKVDEKFPLPAVPYNRAQQFGGWLRDTSGKTCMNTRGKVLVRDSVDDVTLTANGCTVVSGNWDEPYTGKPHLLAKDIQIDHVVALKNAYMTGGHEWNFAKRCLYANYMGNKFHLLSTDGPQNLKKSDQSPAGYVPPNNKFVCEFLKDWLNVKLIWSLRITPKEGDAIHKIAADHACNHEMFVVTAASLNGQRKFMEDNAGLCDSVTASLEAF